jgi:hypothetical protein
MMFYYLLAFGFRRSIHHLPIIYLPHWQRERTKRGNQNWVLLALEAIALESALLAQVSCSS